VNLDERSTMSRRVNPRLIAGAVAGLAVAGGGAAVAATHFGSPREQSRAVLNDAAKQLGVQPSELSAALKKALENRVDDAVAAGRLTKEEGNAIKQRIEPGLFPLFGGPGIDGPRGPHLFGAPGDLGAAADYLGLTTGQLEQRLNDGKTLAEVAKAEGKSVDSLVDAMYDAANKRLDAAVAAGRLTAAQEKQILSDLKSRLRDFAENAQLRVDHQGRGFRAGHGDFRGPRDALLTAPGI
jgi:polyhydroxyalkanoate synthesis regulator phasin